MTQRADSLRKVSAIRKDKIDLLSIRIRKRHLGEEGWDEFPNHNDFIDYFLEATHATREQFDRWFPELI